MDGVVKRTSTKTCTHLGREPLEGDQCALAVDVGGEVVHARDLAQALSGGLLVQEDLFRVGYGVLFVGGMVTFVEVRWCETVTTYIQ